MNTLTETERTQFLSDLGLNPHAPGLTDALATSVAPVTAAKPEGVRLAPDGVDPRTMPVSDIVLDTRLLDGFASLYGEGMHAASAYVFALYKSYGRNKDRNGLLHRRISEWITQVRTERESGGYVRNKVKATKEQREIANLLASQGIAMADLVLLLKERKGASDDK